MINKLISILKLAIFKVRYGRLFIANVFRSRIAGDTKLIIRNGGRIRFCGNIRTQSNVHFAANGGELTIGGQVSFNWNDIIVCREKITIGNNCSFGPNVCIYDHDHVFGEAGFRKDEFRCSDVVIEEGCWIGAGVIILRGTHIGENSVIGAGTVIHGDIPANSLVKSIRDITIEPIKERSE